jgi:hypothetical protein
MTTISDHDAAHEDAEMHRGGLDRGHRVPARPIRLRASHRDLVRDHDGRTEGRRHNRVDLGCVLHLYTDITPARTPQAVA